VAYGHRVVIFPQWLKANLVGETAPIGKSASLRRKDMRPLSGTTGKLSESARKDLSRRVSAYLEHPTSVLRMGNTSQAVQPSALYGLVENPLPIQIISLKRLQGSRNPMSGAKGTHANCHTLTPGQAIDPSAIWMCSISRPALYSTAVSNGVVSIRRWLEIACWTH
jgi:hypothetical protein